MNLSEFNIINEAFYAELVSPIQLDYLLAEGWRHFGTYFFRYSVGISEHEPQLVLPLRIPIADFDISKSQKRNIKKNSAFDSVIRPAEIDTKKHDLFRKHAVRFDLHKPQSLLTFVDENASDTPVETLEFCVYDKSRMIAVSFLDLGEKSVSSVYAMFDPEYSKFSLGIYTMLLEINYARESGRDYLYQGYAYEGESFYDYKKRFSGTEYYDWYGTWSPLG